LNLIVDKEILARPTPFNNFTRNYIANRVTYFIDFQPVIIVRKKKLFNI
jgi:hypothetical protein